MLDHVARRIIACGNGRLRIGIDGFTASGKSSLGHELADRIAAAAGRQVLRASLDDFKRPWRDRHLCDRESGEGYYRNAFDYAAVQRLLLQPLSPGGSGECALCSIDPLTQIDHHATTIRAADDAILIVDGVFAFRPEIYAYWDLRIWLEVSAELSISRGVERDRPRAGDAAASVHRDRYLASELLYLKEADPVSRANLVIDNSDFDRPSILREQ